MAASICSGVGLRVSGSMSTKTGVKLFCRMTFSGAAKANEGRITSDPGDNASVSKARCKTEVPEFAATAKPPPIQSARACSNSSSLGPILRDDVSKTASTEARSASVISGFAKGMRRLMKSGCSVNNFFEYERWTEGHLRQHFANSLRGMSIAVGILQTLRFSLEVF